MQKSEFLVALRGALEDYPARLVLSAACVVALFAFLAAPLFVGLGAVLGALAGLALGIYCTLVACGLMLASQTPEGEDQ